MARPKKLTENTSKNWTKEELEQRKQSESKLNEFDKIDIETPSFLDSEGRREFERILPYLQQLPISNLDMAQIISYCSFYSDFVTATNRIKDDGLFDIEGKSHDAFKIKEKSSIRIQQIANTLGMTIDSRLRIITTKEKEDDDPYMKFASDE